MDGLRLGCILAPGERQDTPRNIPRERLNFFQELLPRKLIYHLKIDGWKMIHFLPKWSLFRGHVIFFGVFLENQSHVPHRGVWKLQNRPSFFQVITIVLGAFRKPENHHIRINMKKWSCIILPVELSPHRSPFFWTMQLGRGFGDRYRPWFEPPCGVGSE